MTSTAFAVVRVKPLGAGAGGGELSALREGAASAVKTVANGAVRVETDRGRVRDFKYPHYVIEPSDRQDDVFEKFMPSRINDFLNGVNVNVMCYGQTGSGKTHTMFGPPDLMRRAGSGIWGMNVMDDYGICPRGIIEIVKRLQEMKVQQEASASYFLRDFPMFTSRKICI